jgi:hypothetical protein
MGEPLTGGDRHKYHFRKPLSGCPQMSSHPPSHDRLDGDGGSWSAKKRKQAAVGEPALSKDVLTSSEIYVSFISSWMNTRAGYLTWKPGQHIRICKWENTKKNCDRILD